MGINMAPEYAILFMDKPERNFLNTQQRKPLVWFIYIDDIFMIWPHSREALNAFMSDLNEFHQSTKFTSESSQTSIPFLDTRMMIDEKGNLTTTLYKKPTCTSTSTHATHIHKNTSIPYSQAIRTSRICSTLAELHKHAQDMKENFLKRGYPTEIIDKAIRTAGEKDRAELFHPKDKSQEENIQFIVTHNPNNPPIKDIIIKRREILERSPETYNISRTNFRVTTRRSTSLRQIL